MEVANHLILLGSGLILVSIFAGMISSRFGAPLLLVFLVLGMLAGEDGPGQIRFDDYRGTYLVGSISLAIILFDGGLRTSWKDFRSVGVAASVLATAGVLITAAVTAVAARYFLAIDWLEAVLIGSIVASTDAAAVFLLLSARGIRLRERPRAILEAEAGLNDPMAVLLTVTCVALIGSHDAILSLDTAFTIAERFAVQIVGGLAIGIAGGYLLLGFVNGLNIAPGLYPVLVAAGALALFAGAQEVGASGYLAVYIAGLIMGNNRHKATLLITRFQDGLAWLSQIVMFLMLGLLVTPHALAPLILPALGIAAALIFVARPVSIALCLPFFRYTPRELGFVSWVGLRGAVPIFLGTIPVLAHVDGAQQIFGVVYVVVLASLVLQGWSVGAVGRRLGMLLPPRPDQPPRIEIDLPSDAGRNITAYTVQMRSLALLRPVARLPLPEDVNLVSIIRDGSLHDPRTVDRLAPGDDVLLMMPAARQPLLDRLFGERRSAPHDVELFGAFQFDGATPVGSIADVYDFWVPENQRLSSVADFLARNLMRRPEPGRRLRLGAIELIVARVEEGAITRVNVDVDPRSRWSWRHLDFLRVWALGKVPAFRRLRRGAR